MLGSAVMRLYKGLGLETKHPAAGCNYADTWWCQGAPLGRQPCPVPGLAVSRVRGIQRRTQPCLGLPQPSLALISLPPFLAAASHLCDPSTRGFSPWFGGSTASHHGQVGWTKLYPPPGRSILQCPVHAVGSGVACTLASGLWYAGPWHPCGWPLSEAGGYGADTLVFHLRSGVLHKAGHPQMLAWPWFSVSRSCPSPCVSSRPCIHG